MTKKIDVRDFEDIPPDEKRRQISGSLSFLIKIGRDCLTESEIAELNDLRERLAL